MTLHRTRMVFEGVRKRSNKKNQLCKNIQAHQNFFTKTLKFLSVYRKFINFFQSRGSIIYLILQ